MADLRIRDRQLVAFREFASVPEIRFMVTVALRNRMVVDQIGSELKKSQLAQIDRPSAVAWAELYEHVKRFNSLPTLQVLNTRIRTALSRHRDLLTPEEIKQLGGIVRTAFQDDTLVEDGDHVDMALGTCRQFLHERIVSNLQSSVITTAGVQENVVSLLQQASNSLLLADTLTEVDDDELFADGWDIQEPEDLIPFNVDVFDQLTGGGLAGSELMTLMAPYGSCKTLSAVYSAAKQAMWAHTQYTNGAFNGKKPVIMHVSLETSKAQFQERILSYQAKIPRKRLRHMTVAGLSREEGVNSVPHQPGMKEWESTQYEEKLYGSVGWVDGFHESEYARVMTAANFIKEYVYYVDFTGGNPRRSAAIAEGASGIAKIVRAYLRKNPDRFIVSLWLDHLSALVVDNMVLRNIPIDPARMRIEIKTTVRGLSREVAAAFNIPVVVLHQLSAESNAKSPTQQNHHTDGAECRSVAEFADFAIQAGNVTTDELTLCRFDCTKHRREPPRGYAIVHVDGAFTRLQDVSADYVIAPNMRRFVAKRHADLVGVVSTDHDMQAENYIEDGGAVGDDGDDADDGGNRSTGGDHDHGDDYDDEVNF